MNGLRRTFSFRKKSKKHTETAVDTSKPQQWLDDEAKIKDGCCSFQVKYLGNIEVYESRGMQVCEEAIKALRKSKKKPQKAILYVSGDALRVSDDVSQHLIVDQTIEKVSFCAPDRGHEKGFAYICRDGATRRWMCHAFLAVKESGERLSHAVGCAFAICLEKKQKRERDALQLATSEDRNFTRVSSFRPASLAERLIDPQSTILTEPPTSAGDTRTPVSTITHTSAIVNSPASPATLPGAIPRPRPSPSITERQSSLRLFPKLQDVSPFKRDLSLRLEELPSNLQRLARITNGDAIPEETGTEVDEPLSKTCPLFSKSSTKNTPAHPVETSQGRPTVDITDLDELVSFSPTSTTAPSIQSSSTAAVTTATTTTTPLASSFFTDPFSAAPFNPATIQQHQAGLHLSKADPETNEAKQLSVWTTSTGTSSSSTVITTAVPSTAPTSPFLGGPPIAVSQPTPVFGVTATTASPWHSNGSITHYNAHSMASSGMFLTPSGPGMASPLTHSYQPQQMSFVYQAYPGAPLSSSHLMTTTTSPFASQTYPTVYPGTAIAVGSSAQFTSLGGNWSAGFAPRAPVATTTVGASPWSTSVPSLLPPEPDRFADPFDVGWADRATAAFTSPGPSSLHKPGNPFLTNPDAAIKPGTVNGHDAKGSPSPVKEDPFS